MSGNDFATTCTIEAASSMIGKKIRVAGRILSYDPDTYLLLLADHSYGLLLDMRLCLDPSQSLHYLRESRGTLMVLGTLEPSELPLDVPILPKYVEAPSLDDQLVLRVIVARSVNDLRLDQWRLGIKWTHQTDNLQTKANDSI